MGKLAKKIRVAIFNRIRYNQKYKVVKGGGK